MENMVFLGGDVLKRAFNRWLLPESYDLVEGCKEAQKAGFDGIEINVTVDGDEISLIKSTSELEELATQIKDIGIEVASILPVSVFPNIAIDASAKTIDLALERLEKLLEIALIFDTDAILMVPGGLWENEARYDQAFQNGKKVLKEMALLAEEKEVVLAVENVWNKFLVSPIDMARFVDEIGSPCVKSYFDVGNILAYGWPDHWIEILGDRIYRVHVKDWKTSVGNITGFCNLLEGDIDWRKVMESFKKIGYNGWFTAELPPYKHHPETLLYETALAMEKIITG